ncbi:MAG: hypothetical protein A3C46_08930 [Deltaproteobacteria bacterium RIFCSPHIGHO2_02_FULL_44_16]|nr:MAG: hypothetical protein A3C46_08930 [Deltaproteobacteria bacterium RIFCSPHIGHO2_02_FULL_44_16]
MLCQKASGSFFWSAIDSPKEVPDTFLHKTRAKKMSGTFWLSSFSSSPLVDHPYQSHRQHQIQAYPHTLKRKSCFFA